MNVRMVTAELLRLRKNRALFAWMVVMTTGAVAALYLIGQAFHLNDSVHNGPAGGADNLRHGIVVISFVGSVAAAILGSTVGTSDLSSGVLRDLIVTGGRGSACSRRACPACCSSACPLPARRRS